jgi:hypothetical protein
MRRLSYQMKFILLAVLAAFAFLVNTAPVSAGSSVNIPLDSPIYNDLETLSLRGLIKSGLFSIRPITRTEAGRLIFEAVNNLDKEDISLQASTKEILSDLQWEFRDEVAEIQNGTPPKTIIKPIDKLAVKYRYLDGPYSSYNNEGITYSDGNNVKVDFQSYGELWNVFSYYVQPMALYNQKDGDATNSDGDTKEVRLQKGYIKLTFGNLELEAGRDALWWGPGYRGTLLMSNNAQPFDMIKLSNPQATLLPSILKYLGPFKFNLVFSELNDNRPAPYRANPYFYGLRLDFKPHSNFEIGMSQNCLFSGAGNRDLSFTDILNILYSNENLSGKEESNQQVAIDVALTVPNVSRLIPLAGSMKVYGEWGAEDTGLPPDRRAYIVGAMFHDVLRQDNLKFRVEYANTSPKSVPGAWYNHPSYPMRYEERVFGHHAGGDADDLFFELSQDRLGRYSYKIGFDEQRKGLDTKTYTEETYEAYAEIGYALMEKTKMLFKYGYQRIKNYQNVADDNRNNHLAGAELQFSF